MNILNINEKLNITELIKSEIERIVKQVGKNYLTIKDIMELTGLGRDYTYRLLNSDKFPSYSSGNRKLVSVSNFVTWQFLNNRGANNGN